ncbi:MAG: ATP-binding protein [Bacilli bacterium]|nr:ATP-binding protein [Bacilli bacterium]MDD4066035.1 ATP-binding protein [Bacilli bacterium]
MLIRENYLNKLIAGKDINLIKVITGVRRSGKSTLLLQYKDYLKSQKISDSDIIYMNFESAEWYGIRDYEDLYNQIKNQISGKSKKYILLDEVQNVLSWEKGVNALLVDVNSDIYITGSNAYLLSSELTTLLAGRVLTIKIYPFSFKEFLLEYPFKENEDKYDKFDKYLKYGGMPMLVNMNDDEWLMQSYLTDLKDVVLKKDVINRNKIKDPAFLDRLIDYMASVIGSLTTPCAIAEYLRKNGSSITSETISTYLSMLENAYLIYRVPRYELKGKQLLKTQGKYYFIDNGLRNIISGLAGYDSGSSYENLIYIELLRRGYEVFVGEYNDLEIDFIAVKPNERVYYQVTRSILDEKVEEREKRSLLAIKDNYKKVILTMDNTKNKQIDGIEVINIIDFLMK